MQSTQLTCPHCGSTLTFGMEILAGTPVECLICMQVFKAEPTIVPPAPAPAASPPEAPKPKSNASATAVVEAPPAPPPVPKTEKNRPSVNPAKRSAPANKGESIGAGTILLALVAFGLLFVLTGGIGLAVWRIASLRSAPGNPNDPPLNGDLAQNKNPLNKGGDKSTNDPNDPPQNNGGNNGIDDDDERRKLDQKNILERKKNGKDGNLPFNNVSTITLPKQVVPGLDQQKVNSAIEKGVGYLKKTQAAEGTWNIGGHHLGHAAIGGLTLLECGVPASDPSIQRVANYVRSRAGQENATYDVSLAVLFLDRLGDPRDRFLIQGLALRILAAQNDCGGWSYNVVPLNPQEMFQLFAFLQSHRQPSLHSPVAMPALQSPLPRDAKNPNDPFQQFSELVTSKDGKNPGNLAKTNPKKAQQPIRPDWLQANLQNLALVRNQGKRKGQVKILQGGGDNSNTQFALLAVWAARRHGVPTDTALLAAYHRFEVSQAQDGGWAYNPNGGNSTPAMTCVGLLGQAMGHGTSPEIIAVNPNNPKDVKIRPALEDPAIQKAIKCLSRHIGEPSQDANKTNYPVQNLYFLWSVERVAMLYDLNTIGGKNWYGWGAQILVHTQHGEGSWRSAPYPGGGDQMVDTCFALLFLRRSNLVQDLTHNLRLHSAIREPD